MLQLVQYFCHKLFSLGAVYVLGLEALGAPLDLEFYLRAFLQSPVAGHLNSGKMDEHIFAARTLDESIALGGVKPLHYTLFSHYLSPISFPGEPG
jgi:hypothetical protein